MTNEAERPAAHQASPDAPLTTEAVPESVTRIDLDDTPSDIPPGTMIEINLIGTGPARTYALIVAFPLCSDAEKVLIAADTMARCVEGIRQALDERLPPDDVEHWKLLIRRLCWVEVLLEKSGFPGTFPLIEMIERGRELLLSYLQDSFIHDSPPWSSIMETVDKSMLWCQQLAAEADASIEEYRASACTPVFYPLGSRPLTVNCPVPLLRGLQAAKRLGLDMSTFEVGYGCQGDVVLAVRGRKVEGY